MISVFTLGAGGKPFKILLVEKHSLSRDLLSSMLSASFSYTTTSVNLGNTFGSYLVVDTVDTVQAAIELVVDHNTEYNLVFMVSKTTGLS